MRFIPSSLSSNSHRLLTALVDSRHKKVYKVKNCVTDIDPEREKEQKGRAESQTVGANELLNWKKKKVNRKYMQTGHRECQLLPGFLEDALDEGQKGISCKSSLHPVNSSRHPVNFSEMRLESEYQTEGDEDERSPQRRRVEEQEREAEEDDHDGEEPTANEASEEEPEEPKHKAKEFGGSLKRKEIESDEDSPQRKSTTHR
ncbi:leo1-like family protein [Actinidia rufa]|uniref:Leo1-like family protein n=1 Tax=Actinidia rufa TaxID=165716 RepID=A0A7J0GN16_9ERIC|nr:leo1-like family protein [Actinidia rufa]